MPCAEAFDDEQWRFSVDWDGCRTLLFAAAGAVRLQAETGADVTSRFPELAAAAAHITRQRVVLDGAVVSLDAQGRPDLEALGLRIALGSAAAGQHPVVYLATDVLHDGEPTLAWPLERRLGRLAEVIGHQGVVQAPDSVEARGRALAEAAGERGLGAVLARRAHAPYRAGVASPDRLRIALRQRATCVLAGIEQGAERPYLVLAEYEAGRLVFSGRVKGPRHAAVEHRLAEQAAQLAIPDSPLVAVRVHRFARAGDVIWLRPELTATVAHRGRLGDGTLREPSLIAVRDDVAAAWCVRRAPVPAPHGDRGRAFAPTVILPLPLEDTALLPTPTHR